MLAKVEIGGVLKYVKIPETDGFFQFDMFLQEVNDKFSLQPDSFSEGQFTITDMSGTEVDGDIFDELVKSGVLTFKVPLPVMDLDVELVADQASSSVLTSLSPTSSHSSLVVAQTALSPALSHSSDSTVILESTRKRRNPTGLMDQNEAKQMVEGVLRANPKGEEVFNEYDKTKTLTDATRKQMVNILVADMVELHGRVPPSSVRTNYALGIVTLFPYLRDPFSKLGYEHYYDPEGNTGFISWRIKTVQRNTFAGLRGRSKTVLQDGPKTRRESLSTCQQLFGEECREAISTIRHSSDESVVKEKMRATFQYRQKMVGDDASSSVLDVFPRFLDVPGLIDQDFSMMFGDEVSQKFLSKWSTFFKPNIITDCKTATNMDELLSATEFESEENNVICLQSFCCCSYSLQLQGARKKLPRSVQLKQPAILLDILRKEPVLLPSLRVSTQDNRSSFASVSKRRISKGSTLLSTENQSRARHTHQ
ncbi:uncharacterized protein LOC120811737 isoform X3 [Gasterosteus aculeatus]